MQLSLSSGGTLTLKFALPCRVARQYACVCNASSVGDRRRHNNKASNQHSKARNSKATLQHSKFHGQTAASQPCQTPSLRKHNSAVLQPSKHSKRHSAGDSRAAQAAATGMMSQSRSSKRNKQNQAYYDWDAGATHQDTSSQQDPWAHWGQAPEVNKGKGKQASTQQQPQQAQHSQQPSWGSWQQGAGKGKSWDQFSSNADWTNYPAQQQATQAQDTAPSPSIALQPSLQIPQSELQWSGDRPYHQNPRTGEWLCALACTNTYCRFGRPACNFKPKGRIVDDRRSPHSCSHCLAKGTGK